MDTNLIEKNWLELKGKIKIQWSKFNDEEVEALKDDLSLIPWKIQKVYGVAIDLAEAQYQEFKKSVQELSK
jgi:hypothetical protein